MSALNMIELCASGELSSALHLQKQNGKFCDIELIFASTRFPVHGCVVGSSSSYVNRVLEARGIRVMMPKLAIKVPVNLTRCLWNESQLCQGCIEKVIDFMYFRRIKVSEEHMPHIYALGDALEILELSKLCKPSVKVKDITSDCSQNNPSECSVVNFHPTERPDCVSSCKIQCKADSESVSKITDKSTTDLSRQCNQMSCLDLGWTLSDSDNLTCPKCKDSFTNVFMLQQHCNTHLGKFYTCHTCNYSTLKVPDLLRHLKDADHMETVCSLCLYETETNTLLKEHLNEHDHPQAFFCRTCMTRFQTRTALNSHMVKHSTETPFVCSVCGRGFKWKQGLQSHMNIHTSIKNHLCDQCGYSTAHLKSFQDHKIIHSGKKFKCPVSVCQFTSVRKESVRHHLLTHSKEKPYQCEICGQAFSQAKNLRRHATTHDPTADAVQCPYCTFKTMRSDKLKDHFRRCHKDNENVLPIKEPRAKRKPVIWSKTAEETPQTEPLKNLEIKRSERKTKTAKLKSNNGLSSAVPKAVFSGSSENSDHNEKCMEVACEQLFPLVLDKEITLDGNNFILATSDGSIVTLGQDQMGFLVCNPDNTVLSEGMSDVSLQNVPVQAGEPVPFGENASTFDEMNKPLLIHLQVEDTVGSEVEIGCLSNETILSLPEETRIGKFSNENDNLCKPSEKMSVDQDSSNDMHMVILSGVDDSAEICLPFSYTGLTNESKLSLC